MDRSMIDTLSEIKATYQSLLWAHALMEPFIVGQVFCFDTISGTSLFSESYKTIIKLQSFTEIKSYDYFNQIYFRICNQIYVKFEIEIGEDTSYISNLEWEK